MKHRMVTAALSLIGLYVALYLALWKIGLMGPLVCGVGSCEVVQMSRFAYLFGIPVAFFGVAGFLALLVVSLVGLRPAFVGKPGPTKLLVALSGGGAAFSLYLTYLEAFVLEAWCRWCILIAVLIFSVFTAALLGLRQRPSKT